MIDVLLLGEIFWVWSWVRTRSAERALLYVAAICTSLFVAQQISPWFAQRFMESGSAFEWLSDRIQAGTHPVGLVARVVPAEPTGDFYSQSQWIALHVLQGLLTALMTWAIFMLFIVIEYLMQAFWDEEWTTNSIVNRVCANTAGFACGFVVAISTVWFCANLSWIAVLHNIGMAVNQSMILLLATHIVQTLAGL
ncbi:hypothetical protein [Alicyclobacillus fodiniaquatilis]|uniref:Colicin V production protein n=1 Tax=Alicyclobacillus fodiniaquatilis TaxID=1661150 RepID=A0ABW4JI07_9BACL